MNKITLSSVLTTTALMAALLAPAVSAQSGISVSVTPAIPRTAYGKPDFNGTFSGPRRFPAPSAAKDRPPFSTGKTSPH